MNMEQLKAYLISEVRRTADSLSEEAARQQRFTALSTLASNLDGLPDDHPNLFFVWYAWHKQDRGTSSLPEPTRTTANLLDGYGQRSSDNGDAVQFLRSLVDLLEPSGAEEEPA